MRLLAAGLAVVASLFTGCGVVEPDATDVDWAEPELVAGLGERIGVSAALAASAQGVLVAWAGTPERPPAVWVRQHTNGRWSPPVGLYSFEQPGAVERLQLELDAGGNGVAAWIEEERQSRRLLVAHFDARTGWGRGRMLSSAGGAEGSAVLDLEVDPAGDAIVAWRTSRGLEAFFSTGERWTPLLRVVSPDPRRIGSTAVGRHGTIAVVSWTLFNDGSVPGFHGVAEWFGRRIDLATGLAEDTSFTRGTTSAAVARVDPAGRVLALGNAGAAPGSQFIRYEPRAGWQEPEAMGAYSVIDAALDFSGRLLVLLRGRDDASFRDLTLAREWAAGRGWSHLETVLGPSELLGTVPLRIDPTSRATLALARRRAAELQLVRRGSSAWIGEPVPGLVQTLRPGCATEAGDWCVSSSLLALEPGGGAWVAWQQQDEGLRNSLWVQRRLPDAR